MGAVLTTGLIVANFAKGPGDASASNKAAEKLFLDGPKSTLVTSIVSHTGVNSAPKESNRPFLGAFSDAQQDSTRAEIVKEMIKREDLGGMEIRTKNGSHLLRWTESSTSFFWEAFFLWQGMLSHSPDTKELEVRYDPNRVEFSARAVTAAGSEFQILLNRYIYAGENRKNGYVLRSVQGFINGDINALWDFIGIMNEEIRAPAKTQLVLNQAGDEVTVRHYYGPKQTSYDSTVCYLPSHAKGFSESGKKLVETLPGSVKGKNGSVEMNIGVELDAVGFYGTITVKIGQRAYEITLDDASFAIQGKLFGSPFYNMEGTFDNDYRAFCDFLDSIKPDVQKIYSSGRDTRFYGMVHDWSGSSFGPFVLNHPVNERDQGPTNMIGSPVAERIMSALDAVLPTEHEGRTGYVRRTLSETDDSVRLVYDVQTSSKRYRITLGVDGNEKGNDNRTTFGWILDNGHVKVEVLSDRSNVMLQPYALFEGSAQANDGNLVNFLKTIQKDAASVYSQ